MRTFAQAMDRFGVQMDGMMAIGAGENSLCWSLHSGKPDRWHADIREVRYPGYSRRYWPRDAGHFTVREAACYTARAVEFSPPTMPVDMWLALRTEGGTLIYMHHCKPRTPSLPAGTRIM